MAGTWVRATTLAELGEQGRARFAHGEKRIAVFRAATGVRAVDDRCPHQGYSLLQGSVKGDVLTCDWHNWKFDLAAGGACTFGGEDVRSYPVEVRGDEVWLDVTDPAPDEISPVLFASLLEAMRKNDVGRIARDTARLRQVGVPLAEVVREGMRYSAPRAEFGWNHSLATLTDCLAMSAAFDRDLAALPVIQGLSQVADIQVRRPPRPRAEPVDPVAAYGSVAEALAAFPVLVDEEELDAAEGLLRGLVAYGAGAEEIRGALLSAVTDHFLGFGHPMIYTQKAFELLDVVGWQEADAVLSPLVPATVLSTRYDKVPYMRRFLRTWQAADLDLAGLLRLQRDVATIDRGYERAVLDEGPEGAFDALHRALRDGVPVPAIVDATMRASAERFARFDIDLDLDDGKEWGWLDLTHTLTYLAAFRWAWSARPAPDVLRGLFHAVWYVQWTQQFDTPGPRREPAAFATDDAGEVLGRIRRRDPEGAVAAVRGYDGPERALYAAVSQAATEDNAVAPIMVAHAVKVSRAAIRESARSGRRDTLVAAARFLAAPKRERFVHNATLEAIDFVRGRARDES
ncbi:MAG TPA: Rieske 2Fe-2S domain-containing protein [Frankiaceae bacterium]|nr:Rieske 2Fe-2S domain-containing protein [Frankiaceae bacterium]